MWTLIDGTTRPAGELAYAANISARAAQVHLAKLVAGGLLECESQGRHRYFRIAAPEVAALLERAASVSEATRPRPSLRSRALPSRSVPLQFLHSRTCYGHLAGETAVKILAGMLERRWARVRRLK